MKILNLLASVFSKPFIIFLIAFIAFGIGTLNTIRYGAFISSLENKNQFTSQRLGEVLAEGDSIEDLLITFNYDTIFMRPVVFEQDITAPNVLYSLTVGSGLGLGGETQRPTITNTGVLSVNGLRGSVNFESGDNITLTEENGTIKITSSYVDTNTDTKLTEEEVERFIFDGENTGEFNGIKIGAINLSDEGTSELNSGSTLIGVYTQDFITIAGDNLQQVIQSIDTTLSSVDSVSHVAVTLGGTLDYLSLAGQQITLNQIDLTTDITGILPANHMSGAYAGITGVGTITSGTWQGSVISSTYLDPGVILSNEIDTYSELNTIVSDVTLTHNGLIDTSAELAGILGDETGTGSVVFSTSPTFTGTMKLTDSSSSNLIFDSLGSSTWGNVVTSTDFSESTGVGFGIGGNSSFTDIPRFIVNADNSYIGWAMRPGDGGMLGSTNGDGNLMVRGNIGIGTTNPGSKLDVQGAAQFGTGDIDLINATGKIVAINSTYFASVDGSALTNLNASNLASGTVPSARISGNYSGITGVGTITSGTWQGSVIASNYLDPSAVLSSEIDTYSELNTLVADVTLTHNGLFDSYSELNTIVSDVTLTHNGLIDTSAELRGIVTDETGSGALVFGTSPSLTTPNIGAATGTSVAVTGNITAGGNVGIGTTNPGSYRLNVNGNTYLNGTTTLNVGRGDVYLENNTYDNANGAGITLRTSSNPTTGGIFAVRSSGDASRLWVGQDFTSTGYNDFYVGSSSSTDSSTTSLYSIKLARSGNSYINGGNLGIGTTNPGATLDVQGAAQFGSGNVDLINSTGKIVAINSTYFASVDGSALTNLNASNLSTGTVANGRISGSYTGITGTGTLNAGSITSGFGNINIGTSTFTGNGSGLTSLNASNLATGTVPDARISGAYSGLTNLTGSGTATFASFSGNGSLLTSLNASNLSTGTVASARISGSYTGITGTGTLNAGSITSGFGNINIGSSTFTGNGSGLTSLNASNLSTGTVASARISGSYTGITGTGNLLITQSGTSYLRLQSTGASGRSYQWESRADGYAHFSDITANQQRITVTPSGNVGIATVSPTAGKLVVNGGTGTGVHIENTGDFATGLSVLNWDGGDGIYVESGDGNGIMSFAYWEKALWGEADGSSGYGVYGKSNFGTGVYGQTNSGYAGHFNTQSTASVVRFQNTNGSCYVNPTSTTLSCSSDARLKKNITPITNALEKVLALRGVTYQWNNDGQQDPHRLGFIAQEVEQILPELVSIDKETGYKQLASSNLMAVVVNAIQEQNTTILSNKSNIEKASLRLNETGEILDIVASQTEDVMAKQLGILNQINIDKNIQNTAIASQSASLQKVSSNLATLEKMTNDTQAVVAGLQERVRSLEQLFSTVQTNATSAGALDSQVLGVQSEKIEADSLIVTGDTNLNNIGVTGDITAGLLSIKGFDDGVSTPSAIISTMSGPLKIQDQAAGNLEIMGGKVLIDIDGNILVKGSLTVQKLNIDEKNADSKSIGDGIITSGENEVIIKTTSVTNESRVFVTAKEVINTPLIVTEKIPDVSFTVKIAVPTDKDVSFDWLIVN